MCVTIIDLEHVSTGLKIFLFLKKNWKCGLKPATKVRNNEITQVKKMGHQNLWSNHFIFIKLHIVCYKNGQ